MRVPNVLLDPNLIFHAPRVTLFSTRAVFDPTEYVGLPLNIMSLMPVLVHHFDKPTPFCVKVVSSIQQVRSIGELLAQRERVAINEMGYIRA